MFLLSVFVQRRFLLSRRSFRLQGCGAQPASTRRSTSWPGFTMTSKEQQPGRPGFTCQPAGVPLSAAGRKSQLEQLLAAQGAGAGDAANARRPPVGRAGRRKQISQRWARWSCSTSRSPRCANGIAALGLALNASEQRDRESTPRIADLSRRLNVALAQRAGTEPLPFRLLQPAARDTVRPREHPAHRRWPLRLFQSEVHISRPAPTSSTTPAGSR